ncbi:MAG: hypothetical protein ABIG10_02245 [bacterium]
MSAQTAQPIFITTLISGFTKNLNFIEEEFFDESDIESIERGKRQALEGNLFSREDLFN